MDSFSCTPSNLRNNEKISIEQLNVKSKGPFTSSISTAIMLVTKLSLKSMESLQNGLQLHSGITLFVSIDFNENYVASVIAALTLS